MTQPKTITETFADLVRKQAFLALVLFLAVSAQAFSPAFAQEPASMSMKASIVVCNTGDADVDFRMQLPEQMYSTVKAQIGNAEYLGRIMNKSVAWSEIQDLKGEFLDDEHTVNATLRNIGYAKPYKQGKWVIDLATEGLSLVGIENNVAEFISTSAEPAFGGIKMSCTIRMPAESSNIHFEESKGRLYYEYEPTNVDDGDGEIEFFVDAKEKIMSSLAKIYGYEKFGNFWVARSIFKNGTDQVITNLRIRHRVNGMSAWSGWKKARIVYPGQTVIVPFFPVFDIDKIGEFTSTRNAMVEAEYSYEIDGENCTDSDSTKIQMLGRNEVEWSSYQLKDVHNFYETFDNCPQIFAAFTHENDPVVQQVAGTVSRMLDGNPPSTDKMTLIYMKALWIFMEANRISYQLPPGSVVEGRMVQNLKFARDVIRIKAGTCADLAVFWASVCKAAGLETTVCCVPGHAFPAIVLPESKKLVPIEATFILRRSFDDALKQGIKTLSGNRQKGTIFEVKISDYRAEGVHCLDLPRVESDYLQRLSYKLDIQLLKRTDNRQTDSRTPSQTTNQQDSPESQKQAEAMRPKELCGIWRSQFAVNGGTMVVAVSLDQNGESACLVRLYDSFGNMVNEDSDSGVWVADGKAIYSKAKSDGKTYKYPYRFQNESLIMEIDGNEISLNRYK